MSVRKRGQSTLEYVIVLTAIVAAILIGRSFVASKTSASGLGKLFDQATSRVTDASGKLQSAIK